MNESTTPIEDPEYRASQADTEVVQRLADWADNKLRHREPDRELFLSLLKEGYEAIRRDGPWPNDWDMDIN